MTSEEDIKYIISRNLKNIEEGMGGYLALKKEYSDQEIKQIYSSLENKEREIRSSIRRRRKKIWKNIFSFTAFTISN